MRIFKKKKVFQCCTVFGEIPGQRNFFFEKSFTPKASQVAFLNIFLKIQKEVLGHYKFEPCFTSRARFFLKKIFLLFYRHQNKNSKSILKCFLTGIMKKMFSKSVTYFLITLSCLLKRNARCTVYHTHVRNGSKKMKNIFRFYFIFYFWPAGAVFGGYLHRWR